MRAKGQPQRNCRRGFDHVKGCLPVRRPPALQGTKPNRAAGPRGGPLPVRNRSSGGREARRLVIANLDELTIPQQSCFVNPLFQISNKNNRISGCRKRPKPSPSADDLRPGWTPKRACGRSAPKPVTALANFMANCVRGTKWRVRDLP